MRETDFTPDERYIIRYYETPHRINWVVWIIHAFFAALFFYGLYRHDNALLFTAFAALIVWRIYEASHQPRYFRATRSLLQKYASQAEKSGSHSGVHP